MAVEIPRVQRFDAQTPESVGRVQANAPNLAEATAPIIRGMDAGLKTGSDAQQKYEAESRKASINAWDIKTSDVKNQYEVWHKEEVSKIGLIQGDATKAYADFDKASAEKRKELFTGYEGMTGEFQQLLNKKLVGSVRTLQGLRDIQQSTQASKYQDQVVKDTSKINQDNMMSYGMYVRMDEPKTFTELEKFAENIIAVHMSDAKRLGTIKLDENGKIASMDNDVNVKISEDIGNALVPLIKSLNAAGKVAEGKKLMHDYDTYFNAKDRASLIADSDESNVRNIAISKLVDLTGAIKGNDKRADKQINLADIDAFQGVSEPVRFKMKELNDINQRQAKMQNERKAETLVSNEFARVAPLQAGADPYVSKEHYLNSEKGKSFVKNLEGIGDPSQINSILSIIDTPLKSKTSSIEALTNGVANNNLYKLSVLERLKIRAGLDKDGQEEFDRTVSNQLTDSKRSVKKPDEMSASTASEMLSRVTKELEIKMSNYSSDGDKLFPKNSKGKFVEPYDVKLLASYREIVKRDIIALGKPATPQQENDIIASRFKQMTQQRAKDTQGAWKKFFGPDEDSFVEPEYQELSKTTAIPFSDINKAANVPSPLIITPAKEATTTTKAKTATVTPSGEVNGLPAETDRKAWALLYRRAKGVRPGSNEALKKWMQEKTNNKVGK